MKLSDLDRVETLRDKLASNCRLMLLVKSDDFTVQIGKDRLNFHETIALKAVIKTELITYYQTERNMVVSDLNMLGVEV